MSLIFRILLYFKGLQAKFQMIFLSKMTMPGTLDLINNVGVVVLAFNTYMFFFGKNAQITFVDKPIIENYQFSNLLTLKSNSDLITESI